MGLFVSTVSADVAIPELGITIIHPTVNRDMLSQFRPDEIGLAASLTSAITGGTLTWKKTSSGPVQPAADYDSNFIAGALTTAADELELATPDEILSQAMIDEYAQKIRDYSNL